MSLTIATNGKKTKKSRRRGRGYSGNTGGWETVRGHSTFRVLGAAEGLAQTVVEVHPRLMQSNRLITYADIFENFRVLRLELTGLDTDSAQLIGGGVKVGFAYVPGELIDAFPTSFDQVSELDHAAWGFPGQTVLVHLKLPTGILAGSKMYYSTTVTTDAPGSLVLCAVSNQGRSLADFLTFRLDYVFQFYGRTDPAVTMKRLVNDLRKQQLDDSSDSEFDEVVDAAAAVSRQEQPDGKRVITRSGMPAVKELVAKTIVKRSRSQPG
jgi:hypothetical protein